MAGTSSITKPVGFRLANNVYAIIERRAGRQGISVGEYLRKRVKYDTLRKHGGR